MIKIASLHFGSGGGHIFGGLTLWQTFKIYLKEPFHYSLLTDSVIELPFVDETLEVIPIVAEPEKMWGRDRETMLYQYLKHIDPDLIIVDNIWFPVKPFLHEFSAKTAIYFWFLPQQWFQTPPLDDGISHSFQAEDYDLPCTIDPHFHQDGCLNIPPVINIHQSNLQPPEIIRSVLEVPDNKKLALVAHNGHEGEIEDILKNADIDPDEYCLRSISSFDDVSKKLFPLSHYMSGIDLAIGGCGYHFFYETKFYKIPTIYIPQPRIGNEQHWRFEHCIDYEGPFNGADILVEKLLALL
ncbi:MULTISPECIES: hypothetical protein [unclassified Oceanispirochaeta]|uniref:hypothetical protein n=1 Tax=unclassified Oceanispirochaeta TaxID=2635722 RepID=UPI000E0972B6|nr:MULTISPECIES: hypothetical protein [unclassified Oceanispirochaeta]MBF9018321.1 hypothetical protein [Oceanispirochaeta sp. M2]NPD74786.1 hypothetical protein [Oceanispirochaeta sp. M1]RDG29339.1 hypothetical protein DV872_22040 [Oceanispirochaeta sp. M1]